MRNGLIIRLISGDYKVHDIDTKETVIAKPRGIFRIKEEAPKVGDYVEYKIIDGVAIINKINKRKNDLIRPTICNVDQAIVVFSVKEPDLNLNLLDSFLVVLEYNDILPILVFNKMDLLSESELIETKKIINYYHSIGYTTLTTSTKLNNLENLDELISNKISVITGQSGVGKSSILNVLDPNLAIKTAEISKALGRGKHTTRHVELIPFNNGWVADTPGFGLIDFVDMSEVDISHSFIEFFKASSRCKYNGCLHKNEPHCEVKRQVEEGTILKSRYDNYLLFIEEISKRRKW